MLLLLRILTTNILAIRPMYLNWLGNGNCLKQVVREVVWIMRFSGNANKKGGWDNVVVAFRGTQATSIKDVLADLKIVTGNLPEQTKYLDEIARYIDTLHAKNVYSTGHSLGGYLAEYFAAHTMQQRYDWASDFKRSSLFNPAVLNVDSNSPDA